MAKYIYIYIFSFIVWLWIASQIPYTHDDWDWGLDIGLTQLLTGSVNSRYSGNLIIVLITRSRLLKTMIYSLIVWMIPFSISRLNNEVCELNKLAVFLFVNVVLFTMHRMIWQESLGWLSGFANYVTAALCIVLWYRLVKSALMQKNAVADIKRLSAVFVFMFVSQMFIENLTLFFLAANISCLIWAFAAKKDVRTMLVLTVAALAGGFIMFSSNVYSVLLETGHSVGRAITVSSDASLSDFLSAVKYSFDINLPVMFELNPLLCAAALLVVSVALFTDERRSALNYIFCAFNLFSAVFLLLHSFGMAIPAFLINEGGNTHLSPAIFLLVLLQTVYLFVMSREHKIELGFCICVWASVILAFLPLTVIKFYGLGRFHFVSVVIESIYVCEMYFYLAKKNSCTMKAQRSVFCVLAVLMIICSVNMANIYRVIGRTDRERAEIINAAITNKADSIYIPNYSYKAAEYVFHAEPWENRVAYFKEFYGIDPSVELFFIDEE